MEKKDTIIIGAGLVGSLLSIYLSKRGYNVKIYERRSDMRKADLVAGRSINLALSDRGIKALEEVGLMDEIRKICIPIAERVDPCIGTRPQYGLTDQGERCDHHVIRDLQMTRISGTAADLAVLFRYWYCPLSPRIPRSQYVPRCARCCAGCLSDCPALHRLR